jgi:hypothetical protein
MAVKEHLDHGQFRTWVERERSGSIPARHSVTWAPPGFARKTTP